MSRCAACDRLLTDFEATRKSEVTGEYVDLCGTCFGSIAYVFTDMAERADLQPIAETEEDPEFEVESTGARYSPRTPAIRYDDYED